MNEHTLSSAHEDAKNLLSGQYWGELRIFAEVARAKSFNRAAERLNVSHPTIGRKVRRLQDLMGAKLFIATKTGVRLTQRGEELAAALLVLDQSLFSIASDIRARDQDAEGIVRVSITEGLAAIFAVPAIPEFNARHPRIQIHLRSMTTFNDLRENQTDMMLTMVPDERAGLICRKLGALHFLPMASRGYVNRHGVPTRDNIAGHSFIQSHIYQSGAPMWQDWQVLCAEGRIAHYCDNPFAYAMMVKNSLGIGLLGSYTARDRDAVPLDLGVRSSIQFYAVALADRVETRPVGLVFDWLCQIFDATNKWFKPQLVITDLPPTLPALDLVFDS